MRVYVLFAVLTGDRLIKLGEYLSLAAAQACCASCESDGIAELDHMYIGYYDLVTPT
jgi:hypothetical protein